MVRQRFICATKRAVLYSIKKMRVRLKNSSTYGTKKLVPPLEFIIEMGSASRFQQKIYQLEHWLAIGAADLRLDAPKIWKIQIPTS